MQRLNPQFLSMIVVARLDGDEVTSRKLNYEGLIATYTVISATG